MVRGRARDAATNACRTRALAQAAGAPILGVLPRVPDAPQLRDVAIVASRLQLAAATAEVDTVALITAGDRSISSAS